MILKFVYGVVELTTIMVLCFYKCFFECCKLLTEPYSRVYRCTKTRRENIWEMYMLCACEQSSLDSDRSLSQHKVKQELHINEQHKNINS